jgi:hypothetical protein
MLCSTVVAHLLVTQVRAWREWEEAGDEDAAMRRV